jgi:hypothetical protein
MPHAGNAERSGIVFGSGVFIVGTSVTAMRPRFSGPSAAAFAEGAKFNVRTRTFDVTVGRLNPSAVAIGADHLAVTV